MFFTPREAVQAQFSFQELGPFLASPRSAPPPPTPLPELIPLSQASWSQRGGKRQPLAGNPDPATTGRGRVPQGCS